MNEFKGTPGPWQFFEVDDGIGVASTHADVAHCSGFDSNRTIVEERANALLIAAAPDLLAALLREREIRMLAQHSDIHWESLRDDRRACYAATNAAIVKATSISN